LQIITGCTELFDEKTFYCHTSNTLQY